MRKLPLAVLASAFVLTAAASPVNMGGWATVTVDKAPDSLIVGKPTSFVFTVKQHGVTPLAGLKPKVHAKTVEYTDETQGSASELKKKGDYSASITIPKRGEWLITIESGFRTSEMTMKPIRAVEASSKVAER